MARQRKRFTLDSLRSEGGVFAEEVEAAESESSEEIYKVKLDTGSLSSEGTAYQDATKPRYLSLWDDYGKRLLLYLLIAFALIFMARSFLGALEVKEFRFFVNEQLVNQKNSVYEKSAREVIEDNYLSKYKWFFNDKALADNLNTVDVEIEITSKIFSLFDDVVEVYMSESRPVIVFEQEDGKRYLINQQGVAYQEIPADKTVDNGVVLKDQTGVKATQDIGIVSPSTVSFLNDLNGFLQRNKNFKVKNYVINSSQLLPILVLDNKPYYVKLNTARPAQSQYEAIVAANSHLNSNGSTAVEYIDVRVDGQANYK